MIKYVKELFCFIKYFIRYKIHAFLYGGAVHGKALDNIALNYGITRKTYFFGVFKEGDKKFRLRCVKEVINK